MRESRLRNQILSCLLLLAGAAPSLAQQPAPPPKQDNVAKRFLRDIAADQKAIWTSPFRMDKRRFTHLALPLAAGTAALIATDRRAGQVFPNTPDQVRYSRYVSTGGSTYVLAAAVAAPVLVGTSRGKPGAANIGRTAAEALVDAVIVTYVLKPVFWRERPTVGAGKGRFWHGNTNSFPSGHSMLSFAVATAVARNRKTPKWLGATACVAATAVSLSRWTGRNHFPSDMLVGGVFGGLIGNYVATRPR